MSGALTAQRRAVQADRRVAAALLRLSAGSRARAAARAGLQAAAAREAAAMRKVMGDHPGALDLVDRAERLARAARILGADG